MAVEAQRAQVKCWPTGAVRVDLKSLVYSDVHYPWKAIEQSYILRAETKTLRSTSLLVVVEVNETIGSGHKSGVILLLNCGLAGHTSTASLGGRESLLIFSSFLIFNFPTALEITEASHEVQRTKRSSSSAFG